MTHRSSVFRFVSAVCCGTLIALPLQDGYVSLAAPDAATTLANSLRALQDGENSAPRDHWDPKYVEAQLGNDPARTFAWVRDHTYWIPYHGILRGPVGVLMDRQGDSLDRALLLGTMLKEEGLTVRLAHRSIAADQATTPAGIATSARFPRIVRRERATRRPGGDPIRALSAKYRLDAAEVARTLQAEGGRTAQTSATLASRLKDQATRLSLAVGQPADTGTGSNLDAALAAFQDHWWVQTQQAATWRDWELARGVLPAAPDRTIDLASVPDNLYHRITLRVVAERWQGGATGEKVILEHAWHPSSTIGQSVSLAFAASEWPKTFPYAGLSVEQSLRKFAGDQSEWTPVLSIGSERVQQNAVTASGDLTMSTSGNDALAVAKNATRGLGSAINDAFSSSTAPAAPASTAAAPQLSAIWIEYQIDSPGAPARRIRREVFDLLGPAARAAKSTTPLKIDDASTLTRGLAMLMNTDILPVVSQLSPQYVNHLAAQSLIANAGVLNDAIANRIGEDFAAAQTVAGKLTPGPGDLYRLALSRFGLNPMGRWIFVDRPDILTSHQGFRVAGDKLLPSQATDIVTASVGVDPFAPSPFSIRLLQGVFDTNAEAVLQSTRPAPGGLAWAYDGARDWVTLASPADPKLAGLNVSADVRQRIRDVLTSGQIVVAPKAPVAVGGGTFVGWWQVDRQTGEALGMAETGWGQSLPEFAILLAVAASEGFLVAWLACHLTGGSDCTRAGLLGAAFGTASVGLGIGIGALAGGAISTAGEVGEGLAGGLAGEEGSLGSAAGGAGGEAGAAGGEAGGATGAGGGGGGGSGAAGEGAGAGGGGGTGSGPTAAQEAAALKKFFSQAQQMDRGAWPEYDAWLDNPNATMKDLPTTGGPKLVQTPGGDWEYRLPQAPAAPEGGSVPTGGGSPTSPLATTTGGGASPDSPLSTTVAPPGNVTSPLATTVTPSGNVSSPLATTVSPPGNVTSPMATTLPPNGNATSPLATTMTSPAATTVPGCALPCTPGGTANLVGLGGAMNALGGGS